MCGRGKAPEGTVPVPEAGRCAAAGGSSSFYGRAVRRRRRQRSRWPSGGRETRAGSWSSGRTPLTSTTGTGERPGGPAAGPAGAASLACPVAGQAAGRVPGKGSVRPLPVCWGWAGRVRAEGALAGVCVGYPSWCVGAPR